MFTSLDLLVIVFAAFAAIALLSLSLMFLLRNTVARRVCLWVTSAFGLYLSWVAFRIGFGGLFIGKMVLGVLTALLCIGSVVLERVCKTNPKALLLARIVSAVAMVTALLTAVL